jgi:tetratricopeptide (TPR) repeat protein
LAKANFIKCLDEDLEDQSALYNVIYCFEFLDQYDEAIAFLKKYIDRNPYSEIAWHQKGRLYYSIKAYESAVRAFEYATYIDETFLGAFMEKGKALERLERYEEAIESYQRTIELEDPTSYALLRIGKCFEKIGNTTEALTYYNQTVHEDPLLDKGWIAITDYYVRLKNFRKALYYVNKALAIDDQNQAYWKRFATINKALQMHEEAEYGYRKAIECGNFELDTWLFWADSLLLLGEIESAFIALEQAQEHYPKSYEISYRLAGLHFQNQEDEKGFSNLKNGLSLSFKNHKILKELFPTCWNNSSIQDYIKNYKK